MTTSRFKHFFQYAVVFLILGMVASSFIDANQDKTAAWGVVAIALYAYAQEQRLNAAIKRIDALNIELHEIKRKV